MFLCVQIQLRALNLIDGLIRSSSFSVSQCFSRVNAVVQMFVNMSARMFVLVFDREHVCFCGDGERSRNEGGAGLCVRTAV